MLFDSLFAKAESLLTYMVEHDYSVHYIRRVEAGIDWLKTNGEELQSYEDAYRRRTEACSEKQAKNVRVIFSLLQRFDEEGIYPDSKRRKTLGDTAAINLLNEEYSEIVEIYRRAELARGLKPSAVHGFAGAGARFLLAMQNIGCDHLSDVNEAATLAFFTDESGVIKYSYAYQADIACVFKADLGIYSQDAQRILSYFPRIRQRRKNIAYLTR